MKSIGKILVCALALTALLAVFPVTAGAAVDAITPSPVVGIQQQSTIALAKGQVKEFPLTASYLNSVNWQVVTSVDGIVNAKVADGKVSIVGLAPGTTQVDVILKGSGYLSFHVTVTEAAPYVSYIVPGFVSGDEPYAYYYDGYYNYYSDHGYISIVGAPSAEDVPGIVSYPYYYGYYYGYYPYAYGNYQTPAYVYDSIDDVPGIMGYGYPYYYLAP